MATKPKTEKTEGGSALGFLREAAIIMVGALIASTLLRMFLIQVFVIPSRSMENTFLIGDRVGVQKVVGFQRGDVVVFRDDNGWLPAVDTSETAWWQHALMFVGLMPDDSQSYLIKRAIGLPGDRVKCCTVDGQVTVNDQSLDETAYLYTDPNGQQVKPSDFPFDIVVPDDSVFVMGDHRNNSQDSRCHLAEDANGIPGAGAFVRRDAIVGAGLVTVFPFDRVRTFNAPPTFASVPAAKAPAPSAPVITGDAPVC